MFETKAQGSHRHLGPRHAKNIHMNSEYIQYIKVIYIYIYVHIIYTV